MIKKDDKLAPFRKSGYVIIAFLGFSIDET
jgi:hypothetical protein